MRAFVERRDPRWRAHGAIAIASGWGILAAPTTEDAARMDDAQATAPVLPMSLAPEHSWEAAAPLLYPVLRPAGTPGLHLRHDRDADERGRERQPAPRRRPGRPRDRVRPDCRRLRRRSPTATTSRPGASRPRPCARPPSATSRRGRRRRSWSIDEADGRRAGHLVGHRRRLGRQPDPPAGRDRLPRGRARRSRQSRAGRPAGAPSPDRRHAPPRRPGVRPASSRTSSSTTPATRTTRSIAAPSSCATARSPSSRRASLPESARSRFARAKPPAAFVLGRTAAPAGRTHADRTCGLRAVPPEQR